MTNGNNDIEELEELLTELEGQEAQLVAPYSEEDDAVTQLMDAPLGDQEWMVQVTALDRRMMATDQLLNELRSGKATDKTLVWRGGMDDWLPISQVEELVQAAALGSSPMSSPVASAAPSRPLASSPAGLPPPPAALPPQPAWSNPVSVASRPLPPPPVASSAGQPMAAPLPPPPVAHVAQSNTTRPVAVDFSDFPNPEAQGLFHGKKAVLALSAVAVMAVFVTAYAFSAGDDAAAGEAAAQPQEIGSLPPTEAPKAEEPTVAKASATEPSEEETAEDSSDEKADDTASGVSRALAQRNAPARYSPRSASKSRRRAARSAAPSEAEADSNNDADDTGSESESLQEAMKARAEADEPESSAAEEETSAAEEETAEAAPRSTGRGGSGFDRAAAKAALDQAASQARNCRPQGGPSGTGRVQVRYEPSGKVASVNILTTKFDNTTAGSCVRMLFRRARVPEFTGQPVVMVNKSFEIP